MTHKEFIAGMERNESGLDIFQRYRTLYKRSKESLDKEPFFVDEKTNEYIPIVEKLLSNYADYIKQLAVFVHLEEEEYTKVIHYLEAESVELSS